MSKENIKDVFKYLVYQFRDDGRLSTRQLMKLFYKAELRSIEKYGERITDAVFVRGDFGPVSPDIYAIFEEDDIDVNINVEELSKGHKVRLFIPKFEETMVTLTPKSMDVLEEVINEWEDEDVKDLIKSTKIMPPFIWAELKKPIDFDKYIEHRNNIYENADLAKQIKESLEDIDKGECLTFDDPQTFISHLTNIA